MAHIDHVFYSDHFVALRAATLHDSGGSDHRAVFAELALTRPWKGSSSGTGSRRVGAACR